MGWKDIVDICLALATAIIAIVALFSTRRFDKERRKIEVGAHIHAYFRDMRNWAMLVIEKLTEAMILSELDPKKMRCGEFFEQRQQLRCDLSSLLDQGRLFLPNTSEKNIGLFKSEAYRGLRQESLDHLEKGYELVQSLDYKNQEPNRIKRQSIVDAKRDFTSELQGILEVRKTAVSVSGLVDEIWVE